MAAQHDHEPRRDALDDWVTEVGEDYIVGLADEIRRGVAAGSIPAFDDKDAFLRHLTRSTIDKPA